VAIGYQPETAARTVARCRELGWVDDARLAGDRAVALRQRGAGSLKIAADLAARGLGGTLVDEVIDRSRDGRSEREWAAQALERAGIDPQRAPARAWRLLGGRGFPQDVVVDVVGEPD